YYLLEPSDILQDDDLHWDTGIWDGPEWRPTVFPGTKCSLSCYARKITPPEGYYLLKEGDIVKKGDFYWDNGEWKPSVLFGHNFIDGVHYGLMNLIVAYARKTIIDKQLEIIQLSTSNGRKTLICKMLRTGDVVDFDNHPNTIIFLGDRYVKTSWTLEFSAVCYVRH
ncbi:unnamed protein product, partial [marine sediment metagenome]